MLDYDKILKSATARIKSHDKQKLSEWLSFDAKRSDEVTRLLNGESVTVKHTFLREQCANEAVDIYKAGNTQYAMAA